LTRKTFALFPIISAALPAPLKACAVCFGQTNNPNIGRAYFWGILIMLGFTGALLAAIGFAVYRIETAHRVSNPSP